MKLFMTGVLAAALLILTPGAQTFAATAEAPAASASAAPQVPAVDIVFDEDDFLSQEDEDRIAAAFNSTRERYGILPVLEVVSTLNGADPEATAIRRANELGVGDAKADNGLFILFVSQDRELRVEPGIGLAAIVSDSQIQSAVDTQMLPNFREGNYVAGFIGGVTLIGEYSLPTEGGSTSSTFEMPDLTWLWVTLSSLLGLTIAGIIVYLVYQANRRKAEAAETARQVELRTLIEGVSNRMKSDRSFRKDLVNAESGRERHAIYAQELTYAPFKDDNERDSDFTDLDSALISLEANYGRTPKEYFKISLQPNEAIHVFLERVREETPKAEIRHTAALEEERRRREEERARAARKKAARRAWEDLTKDERSEYALATSHDRPSLGRRHFKNYDEDDYARFYDEFGDNLDAELRRDAQRSFDRLPQREREKLARARGREREDLMASYIPGFNPLLLSVYLASSTAYMSSLNAASYASSSSSSSNFDASSITNSFGSFGGGSSFGGGGFDGGGGGGSW